MKAVPVGKRTSPTVLPGHAFTIVLGDDLERASAYAFDRAVGLALRVPGSRLQVVHVAHQDTTETDVHRMTAMLHAYVEEMCRTHPDQSVSLHVQRGEPAQVITRIAADVRADLILVGAPTRMHTLEPWQVSLGALLARVTPVPVLVVEPPAAAAVARTAT